jgi:hypothetical protein
MQDIDNLIYRSEAVNFQDIIRYSGIKEEYLTKYFNHEAILDLPVLISCFGVHL